METLSLGSGYQLQSSYINNGEHDNPHVLPKENSEGSSDNAYVNYKHTDSMLKVPEEI